MMKVAPQGEWFCRLTAPWRYSWNILWGDSCLKPHYFKKDHTHTTFAAQLKLLQQGEILGKGKEKRDKETVRGRGQRQPMTVHPDWRRWQQTGRGQRTVSGSRQTVTATARGFRSRPDSEWLWRCEERYLSILKYFYNSEGEKETEKRKESKRKMRIPLIKLIFSVSFKWSCYYCSFCLTTDTALESQIH